MHNAASPLYLTLSSDSFLQCIHCTTTALLQNVCHSSIVSSGEAEHPCTTALASENASIDETIVDILQRMATFVSSMMYPSMSHFHCSFTSSHTRTSARAQCHFETWLPRGIPPCMLLNFWELTNHATYHRCAHATDTLQCYIEYYQSVWYLCFCGQWWWGVGFYRSDEGSI